MVRHIRLGLLVAALIMALNAVSSAATQPVTITLMWWLSAGPEYDNNMKIIEEFQKRNPDIKVELIPADYGGITDKIKVQSAAGTALDVLWVKTEDYYDLARDGFLMDLGQFIQKDPKFDPSNFLPGVFESARVLNKQYALHRDVWAPIIFYNADWFREAGVAAPRPGWTYDDVLAAAKRLTDPMKKRFGMGNIDFNKQALIYSFGGQWMNREQTEFTLHEENALRAIQFMRDFRWVHHVQPQPGELPDWWEPQWVRGQVAMQFWGPWAWAPYQQSVNFEWDLAPAPAGPAGTFTSVDGLLLGISTRTKHPQEAWRLLKFLAYEEPAQTMQVLLGIASPTVRYPQTLRAFHQSEVRPKSIDNYIAALNRGRVGSPRLPIRVTQAIDEAFNTIMNNTRDARSAIEEAERKALAILKEAKR